MLESNRNQTNGSVFIVLKTGDIYIGPFSKFQNKSQLWLDGLDKGGAQSSFAKLIIILNT